MIDEQILVVKSSPKLAKAALIIGVSFFLGLCFDFLFYGKALGINFPIYIVLVISGLVILSKRLKAHVNRETFALLIPLLFFSGMVFVRANGLLTFLNILGSLLLLFLLARVLVNERMQDFLVADYVKLLLLPFIFVRPSCKSIGDLSEVRTITKDNRILSQVVKGMAMAIPFLIIFSLLFSSADLVFKKRLLALITFDLHLSDVFRIFLVFLVTVLFTGTYSYAFRAQQEMPAQKRAAPPGLRPLEGSIFLGSINILFFIFILLQLTYLFGGQRNISAEGFSYAEYARRGFFELITVAVISFLLLLAAENHIVKKESGHFLPFKILASTLVIQVILIMVSAFTRLLLYEKAYGFTTLRLYSHAFIILLAVIFILLLRKIFIDSRESTFAFFSFLSVILFLAAMNMLNPDAFIARKNISRFSESGSLDINYLSALSDDALPEAIKALDLPDAKISATFTQNLYRRAQKRNNSSLHLKWQSFNLSRMKAGKILASVL